MKKRLLAWWTDIRSGDLNPVMVRELRQYIRSRFANWIVVLMLIGLLLIALGFLGSSRATVDLSGTRLSEGNGGAMYAAVAFVLAITSALVALYTAQRLGTERDKQKPDLLFTTSLKPGTIVRGKLYAGLAMFCLLFSLAMPFMTTTYLLRGIDVPTILIGLVALFAGNVVLMSIAVFLGCMPLGPLFRRGSIVMGLLVFYSFFFGAHMFGRLSRGRSVFHLTGAGLPPFPIVLGMLAFLLVIVLFPYATSVLILSPRNSNRFLPYRSTLTFLWAVGLGMGMFYALSPKWHEQAFLLFWLVASSLLMLFMLQVAECTSDVPSRRTLGRVPRSFLGRLVCFPLFSGGVNGLVWALGLLAIGYLAAVFAITAGRMPSASAFRTLEVFLVTGLYVICYILTAGMASRRFPEHTRQGAAAPWLISLYMFATSAMVPLFLDLLHETRKIHYDPDVEYFNAFAMFRGQERMATNHLAVVVPWFVLLMILTAPRLFRAFGAFRRPESAITEEVVAESQKVEAFEA